MLEANYMDTCRGGACLERRKRGGGRGGGRREGVEAEDGEDGRGQSRRPSARAYDCKIEYRCCFFLSGDSMHAWMGKMGALQCFLVCLLLLIGFLRGPARYTVDEACRLLCSSIFCGWCCTVSMGEIVQGVSFGEDR